MTMNSDTEVIQTFTIKAMNWALRSFQPSRAFKLNLQSCFLQKKTAYADLKKVRDEMRELSIHKANYEELRDLEEREDRKEQERGRE